MALDKIVGNVNRNLSGWVNYCHYRNSNLALEKLMFTPSNRYESTLRNAIK